uniref:Uncharacterized protein n=1 Tax=viral metagenome TaxID=1070528 RepID=A0A6M3L9E6_9ZZZZ
MRVTITMTAEVESLENLGAIIKLCLKQYLKISKLKVSEQYYSNSATGSEINFEYLRNWAKGLVK